MTKIVFNSNLLKVICQWKDYYQFIPLITGGIISVVGMLAFIASSNIDYIITIFGTPIGLVGSAFLIEFTDRIDNE